jgi:hypothetical protein
MNQRTGPLFRRTKSGLFHRTRQVAVAGATSDGSEQTPRRGEPLSIARCIERDASDYKFLQCKYHGVPQLGRNDSAMRHSEQDLQSAPLWLRISVFCITPTTVGKSRWTAR